jgi:hypothetical protein
MPTLQVDIDIHDLLWDLSKRDKQELVDELYDDGYTPTKMDTADIRDMFSLNKDLTYNENELLGILARIWENKSFLNKENLEMLEYFATKGI